MVEDTVRKKNIRDIDFTFDIDKIQFFCVEHHIKSLKFYGSILTENFNDLSDIDLLVEFEEAYVPGFFKLIEIQDKLSNLFQNRSIDLRTKEDLSRYFREDVLNSAVKIYG